VPVIHGVLRMGHRRENAPCRSGGSARAVLSHLHGNIRFGPFRQLGQIEQIIVVEAAGGLALVAVPLVRAFKGGV